MFWRTVIFSDTSIYVTQTIRESICIQFTENFFTQHFLMHCFWKFYIYNIHSESESCSVMSDSFDPMDYIVHGILQARILKWEALLLQAIFPNQGLNPGVSHCRWILYQLSHQGSARILEWVAYPVSSRSSRSRNWTGVSCIAGVFFTNWAIREAQWW